MNARQLERTGTTPGEVDSAIAELVARRKPQLEAALRTGLGGAPLSNEGTAWVARQARELLAAEVRALHREALARRRAQAQGAGP